MEMFIVQFPDVRLRKVAAPVTEFTADLHKLIDSMTETMYHAHAVGLAATQVDIQQRIFVADVSNEGNNPLYFINPEIIHKEGSQEWEEGCLSFPGVYLKMKRAKIVEVAFVDKEGKPQQLRAEGHLAVCIQHELDHLNGITFYDHLPYHKKEKVRKQLEKIRRESL